MHKVHSRLVFVVLLVMIGALLAGLRPCASASSCGCADESPGSCADEGAGGRTDQRTRSQNPRQGRLGVAPRHP